MVEILRHDSRQHLRQEEGQHPGRLWVAKEIARHDGVVGDVEFAVLEAVLHDLDGVGPLGLVQHRQDQPGREGRVVSKEPVRVLAEDHLAGASPRRAHAVRAPFDEARLRQVRAREEDVVHARRRRQAAPQGRARELTVLVEEQEGQDRREPPESEGRPRHREPLFVGRGVAHVAHHRERQVHHVGGGEVLGFAQAQPLRPFVSVGSVNEEAVVVRVVALERVATLGMRMAVLAVAVVAVGTPVSDGLVARAAATFRLEGGMVRRERAYRGTEGGVRGLFRRRHGRQAGVNGFDEKCPPFFRVS